jgi:hypothetical protein
MLKDSEVKKNYMIASMAQSLKTMASYVSQHDLSSAKRSVTTSLNEVNTVFKGKEDQDVQKVKNMLEVYVRNLDQRVSSRLE